MFPSPFDRRALVAAVLSLSIAAGCTGTRKTPRPPAPVVARPWWQEGVCYEVFVRSFYDSDGDGIGDLKGLTARLDYINDGNPPSKKSLGASCIWLMPIDKASSYHGYDVIDYYHVDPQYGTDDDFRALVAEAHRRGIHVIVDFVPNHSSSDNPWFRSALRGPGSPYRDWYRWSNTAKSEKGPWGQELWHKSAVRDEYYYGLFWHGMPDLNYETPALMQEMLNVTRYWLAEMHADGFRFDAIPYLVEVASSTPTELTRCCGTSARRFARRRRARSRSARCRTRIRGFWRRTIQISWTRTSHSELRSRLSMLRERVRRRASSKPCLKRTDCCRPRAGHRSSPITIMFG